MSKFIRGGVPREFNLNGYDFHPAEGENINYKLSGFGGPAHIAGDGDIYGEYNPLMGGWTQSFSVDGDDFKNLVNMQSSTEKVVGYWTMPNGETYNFTGKISNDGSLENDNGVVSVEFSGNVEAQG